MADTEPIAPPAHYDRLAELIATFPLRDRRLAEQMVQSMVELFAQHPATIDLKITSAAIAEMSDAFAMFAPYRDRPKVTIFGSARTLPDDPLYVQARQVAEVLAGETAAQGKRQAHGPAHAVEGDQMDGRVPALGLDRLGPRGCGAGARHGELRELGQQGKVVDVGGRGHEQKENTWGVLCQKIFV